MSRRAIVLVTFIAACFLLGTHRVTATAPVASPSPDAAGVQEYAAYLDVDSETAAQYLALTRSTSNLQDSLESQASDRFAGVWVEYAPNFRAIVAHTGKASLEVDGLADAGLIPFVDQREVTRTLASLISLASKVELGSTPGATFIDVKANQVVIETLADTRENAQVIADQLTGDASIRVDVVSELPRPVANIYGGLNLDVWCGVGLSGTSGFSVVSNSTEVTGILTAGHLGNCLKYGSTQLALKGESLSGNADAQWHSSTFTEQPWIHIGAETRTITGQRTYSSIVIGEMFCKYGRTTGYGCGTVETKTVDPDAGGPLNGVFVRVAHCGVEDLAEPGDSGGPVFVGHAAVGIITHEDGDIFCGGKMVFNSVTHSQSKLGVTVLFGS